MTNYHGSSFDTSNDQPAARPAARARRFGGFGPVIGAALVVAGLGAWSQRAPEATGQAASPQTARVAPLTPPAAPAGMVTSYADLVARVTPAVVTVRSERLVQQTGMQGPALEDDFLRRFFGQEGNGRAPRMRPAPRRQGGLGSGVVVTADGYILTNNHVVEGAEKVRVDFTDGRTFEARVVGADQASDLAVLKVAATSLPTVPLGNSDQARVGDVVLAVGNPLGLGQTVTMGIVSAKGRSTGGGDAYEDFIQTDAPINHGNSGGALVNARGELVGINTQILSPSGGNIGIGFSIPSNMAQDVMQQLIKTGKVQRGMLGVTVQGVTPDMAKSLGLSTVRGAIVNEVRSGTPAERAGIRQGDVILSLDGKEIDSSNTLRTQVGRLAPGTSVKVTVMRDGREREITASLGEMERSTQTRGDVDTPEQSQGRYGLAVEPLTPELARSLNVKARDGVVVANVDPSGAAAEAGLQEGDVIEQVNQQPVRSAEELRAALDGAGKEKPALLLVNRGGAKAFFTMQGRNG